MTEALLDRAGVGGLVERNLAVGSVGRWKPAIEPYAHACSTLGVDPRAAVLIAVHPWDIHGAKCAGLTGAWLDRHGGPYPDFFMAPDVTASDLLSVAEELVG